MGSFYHSAKAFAELGRIDPDPEHWEGLRGACVGLFQRVVGKLSTSGPLSEVMGLLQDSANPQEQHVVRTIRKWAKENSVSL
jgi:intraflagellar transport protein 56